ncbi:hypothetical protein M8818_005494 [Zalaria obscura]|uniref:Uncharacterized protein n=1 Tax=Zalaria obscura TaxID=2024903 RepID=A0ACC3S853_9PEZI
MAVGLLDSWKLSVLTATRSCHATDPRDKVFALLPEFTNYTKSCRQVYHEVAKEIMQSRFGLGLLADCSGDSRIPKLMSWVPDWSQGYTNPCNRLRGSMHWAGGTHMPPQFPPSDSPFCIPILVHGVQLGTAEFVGLPVSLGDLHPSIYDEEAPGRQEPRRICETKHAGIILHESYFPFETYLRGDIERISPELSRLRTYRAGIGLTEDDRGFPYAEPGFVKGLRNVHFFPAKQKSDSWTVAYSQKPRDHTDHLDIYPNLLTSDGFIGVAPENTKYGDVICVLVGCPEPMILRKVADGDKEHYVVVGSCWVAGAMQGESFVHLWKEIYELNSIPGDKLREILEKSDFREPEGEPEERYRITVNAWRLLHEATETVRFDPRIHAPKDKQQLISVLDRAIMWLKDNDADSEKAAWMRYLSQSIKDTVLDFHTLRDIARKITDARVPGGFHLACGSGAKPVTSAPLEEFELW